MPNAGAAREPLDALVERLRVAVTTLTHAAMELARAEIDRDLDELSEDGFALFADAFATADEAWGRVLREAASALARAPEREALADAYIAWQRSIGHNTTRKVAQKFADFVLARLAAPQGTDPKVIGGTLHADGSSTLLFDDGTRGETPPRWPCPKCGGLAAHWSPCVPTPEEAEASAPPSSDPCPDSGPTLAPPSAPRRVNGHHPDCTVPGGHDPDESICPRLPSAPPPSAPSEALLPKGCTSFHPGDPEEPCGLCGFPFIDHARRPFYCRMCTREVCIDCEPMYGLRVAAASTSASDSAQENMALRLALLEHRADLHHYSGRPCPTCRQSAKALGLDAPDSCAVPATAMAQLRAAAERAARERKERDRG